MFTTRAGPVSQANVLTGLLVSQLAKLAIWKSRRIVALLNGRRRAACSPAARRATSQLTAQGENCLCFTIYESVSCASPTCTNSAKPHITLPCGEGHTSWKLPF